MVLAGIVIVAAVIFFKAFKISVSEDPDWREKGNEEYRKFRVVEGERGNILSEKGSLMATSLPFFDIAFDPNSSAMSQKDFDENIDSLSMMIATHVNPDLTSGGWWNYVLQKRAEGSQYIPIVKNATLEQKELIGSFPLFNLGQYKGGFIAERNYERRRPFNMLARRTIGYSKVLDGDTIMVGLEGSFNKTLQGGQDRVLMTKASGGNWIPVEDLSLIQPESGKDIRTTLDVNLQDIVENALYKAVKEHRPKFGVAIVMEVETGAIRAIANLGEWNPNGGIDTGDYDEVYNNAIGSATEPGSTYKLASIMSLMEDGYVKLDDLVELDSGVTNFYEERMADSYRHKLDTTTVQRAFEISSNVGIAKLMQKNYAATGKEEKYLANLKKFHLNTRTGIEIQGEPKPYIKRAWNDEDEWSGTTIPWMSIGYEVTCTPLQLLSFYNAVANDGIMMKPYLVSKVEEFGEQVEKFPVKQIGRGRIASKQTIKNAQILLESVVENGTAEKYKTDAYRFAGKTGTTQLGYKKIKNRRRVEGHQASFVGYFPADNPKYSCIVLLNSPKGSQIYGGKVALPVFREIADKVMDGDIELYATLNDHPKPILTKKQLPDYDVGHRQDIQTVLSYLDLPFKNTTPKKWAVIRATESDSLKLLPRTIKENRVPNVVGMGLRDAIYILENLGLQVKIKGYGRVKQQSIKVGTKVHGQTIWIRLG